MSSRAPCFFNEEADTRMFAHATEAAKMTNKKISSHTVGTDIVVLAIHVVQQLRVDELWGWQKSLAIVGMKSNCLVFFYSLTACDITSSLLGRGKQWASFPAVTEYFVKMNSLPEKRPTDFLYTIEQFITVLYGRTNKHLHEHRHG